MDFIKRNFWKIFWFLFGFLVLGAVFWRLSKINWRDTLVYFKSHLFLTFLFVLGILIFGATAYFIFRSQARKLWLAFLGILVLTAIAGAISWPKPYTLDFSFLRIPYKTEIKTHLGLDLQGGSHLAYEADLSKIPKEEQGKAIEGAVEVIERRINYFGVSEPIIQTSQAEGKSLIIVELAGIKDIEEAISLIGTTAQLEFKEIKGQTFVSTGLTGAELKGSDVKTDPQTGKLEVALEFSEEGKKLFADITRRNLNKIVAISLDQELISAPTVQSVIEDGKAVITGNFDLKTARKLSIQLNAGALPVPLNLTEQRTVGASLGQDSIKKSLLAGAIGLFLLILFLTIYYRLSGIIASFVLIIYALLALSLFKLIPVVLTLPGIAGFILSVAMAIDANILVFERMKEELRDGRPLTTAIETGFRRAFSSIKDSNASALITSAILYWFGTGLVRGFALTLAIGVIVSLFSSLFITKTFLRLTAQSRLFGKEKFFKA